MFWVQSPACDVIVLPRSLAPVPSKLPGPRGETPSLSPLPPGCRVLGSTRRYLAGDPDHASQPRSAPRDGDGVVCLEGAPSPARRRTAPGNNLISRKRQPPRPGDRKDLSADPRRRAGCCIEARAARCSLVPSAIRGTNALSLPFPHLSSATRPGSELWGWSRNPCGTRAHAELACWEMERTRKRGSHQGRLHGGGGLYQERDWGNGN